MTVDRRVLVRIPALAALDPDQIRARPMDGHTNTMLALDTPVGGFALRLPRQGAAVSVDRTAERRTLAAVASLGLAPPALYFADDGTMLTRAEPGRQVRPATSLADDAAAMTVLGRLLHRLHAAPLELPWTFSAVDVVTTHFDKIDQPALATSLLRLADRLDGTVGQRAPCHDDVTAGNILWQDGRPWLIDWEYAGMNDPCFDLATAQIELGLGNAAFAGLLQGWGQDDLALRRRIDDYATLALGIAGAWYLNQGHRLDAEVFVRLGRDRLARCRTRLTQV